MIKFRAWDKENESYLYDVQDTYDTNESCFGDFLFDNERYAVEQFTWLTDSDGKNIYEGDIVHFGSVWCVGDEYDPREEEYVGAVEYRPDYASYVVNCNGRIFPLVEVISFDGYSVQGNVHENSELLEEE